MRRWMGVMFCVAALCGCDQSPAPPPQVIDQAKQQDASAQSIRPTTQELLTGQYVKLNLPAMPLSLRAPASWKFETVQTLTHLEGPVPSSEHGAVIQIGSPRQPLPADRFDAVVDRLKKETEAEGGSLNRVDMRKVGDLLILERMSTGQPIVVPKVDYRGNAIVDERGNTVNITSTPIRWNLSVFIAEGAMYNRYELSVVGLAVEDYATDKELLEKILYSLAHEVGPATLPKAQG